jgi:mycofactocin precursor
MTGPETNPEQSADVQDESQDQLVEDALVEEVSIDGMCGVY